MQANAFAKVYSDRSFMRNTIWSNGDLVLVTTNKPSFFKA